MLRVEAFYIRASSVIHVETAIRHSKHREHSALRRVRGARKPESVQKRKLQNRHQLKNEVLRAVDPHL